MKIHLCITCMRVFLFASLVLGLMVPTQPALAAELCVEPTGAGGCYTTIQAAVAAAGAGDTITVQPGTYSEGQIVIDKNLSIIGSGDPVIQPNADITGGNAANAWFLVQSGVTFGLSNVGIDGGGFNVHQAIRSHGITTISNVDFQDIRDSGSPYVGIAISSFGGVVPGGAGSDSHGGAGGPASELLVTNSTFTNIGRIGVLVKGDDSDATITGNTYTGKGAGDWLDYGFEVGAGGTAEITGNTVTGNTGVAASDGSTSAGILVTTYWGPGTRALIQGNVITGNTTGVAVGYDASDASVVTVFHNNLSGNTDLALEFTAPLDSTVAAVDATENWWGSAAPVWATKVSGKVIYDPWFINVGMTTVNTKVTLVAPTGNIGYETNPTYEWNEAGEALEYQLGIKDSANISYYSTWMPATNICDVSGCSVLHSALVLSPALPSLPGGTYTWFVRGRNGSGSWVWSWSWSSPMGFTVVAAPVCYALTLGHTGNGSSPVADPPNSDGCAAGQYVAGATIGLSGAVADAGWEISGWSGTNNNASTAATNTVTMPASAHTANVNYSQIEYTLTTNVVGSGSVGRSSMGPYHYGDVVQLTANPAAGWTFSGWSGDLTGSTNPASITMNENKSITATFIAPTCYVLTLDHTGNGSSPVADPPNSDGCAAGQYVAGATISLSGAVADAGWEISGWSGTNNNASTAATNTVTMPASAHSAGVDYSLIEYSLTITKIGDGSIVANPAGPYHYGDIVQLTAVADFGWAFSTWSGDLTGSTNPASITMDGDKAVTATFVGTAPGAGMYDDTDAGWVYNGTFITFASTSAYQGGIRYTTIVGDSAEFVFIGSQISILYTGNTNRGKVDVFLDNNPTKIATFDEYTASAVYQKKWTSGDLGTGAHTIRLVHAGAAGKTINIDAIEVGTYIPPVPVGEGTYDDGDANWVYNGTFVTFASTSAYQGGIRYTATVGDYAEFTFTGSQISVLYTGNSNRGKVDVFLDGNPTKLTTFDEYTANAVYQKKWTSGDLGTGTHTVRLVHAGAAGKTVNIDAIEVGTYQAPVPPGAGTYDNLDSGWTYNGNFITFVSSNAYQGSIHYTTTVGDSVEFTFSGSQISILYTGNTNRGKVDVFLDNNPTKIATFDQYTATAVFQKKWTSGDLGAGTHTIKLVHAGTAGKMINLDAIEVGTYQAPGAGTYDDADGNLVYDGTFVTFASSSAYQGGIHYTTTVGDSVEFTFTGSQFVLVYTGNANRGKVDVFVDGSSTALTTIDEYTAAAAFQQHSATITVGAGTHTIKLVHAGAAGATINVDAIEVLP